MSRQFREEKIQLTDTRREFPGDPVVKAGLPMQGAWIQSLVRELRPYVPHGTAKKKNADKGDPL